MIKYDEVEVILFIDELSLTVLNIDLWSAYKTFKGWPKITKRFRKSICMWNKAVISDMEF